MRETPLTLESLCGAPFALEEPTLSPDGSTWVFTLNVGATRHLFTMPVQGALPVPITGGVNGFAHPSWSPDGQRLCADSRGGVWLLDRNGSNRRCLTKHAAGDSWAGWFPDGQQLLFGSRRRGWSQVWALPVEGADEAECLTPLPRDFKNARLSPDGRLLACFCQDRENLNRSEVWVFPADTPGDGRCLTPPGEYWETGAVWLPDGKTLLLNSESPADGWARLYRVSVEHPFEQREALTEPGAEESGPLLSSNGKYVAFTRQVRDANELFVGLSASGRPKRVELPMGSVQPLSLSDDGKTLYALRESYTEIPHLARIDVASGNSNALTPTCLPGFTGGDCAATRAIKFRNREGVDIEGRVWTPADVASGKEAYAPLIVRAHGGPSAHFRNCWDPFAQWLVAQGYALLDYDYRGSSGHGREFRRALYGRWGDAEMLDTYDAVAWALANLPFVRRERIGFWGASYGGYMAYHALAQQPEMFRCAVAACGDTELYDSIYHGNRSGRLDTIRQMGDPEANREAYRQASPIYRVEDFQAPLLISHGRSDTQVPVIMTEMLVRELKNQGKFHEVKIYDGEGHGGMRPENTLDQWKRETDFFNRHLKGSGA